MEAFGAVGRVVDAKVPTDRETGRPRGFAFVELESDEVAEKCIQQMNGRDLKGRAIRVNAAEDRPPRPAGAGGGFSPRPGGLASIRDSSLCSTNSSARASAPPNNRRMTARSATMES